MTHLDIALVVGCLPLAGPSAAADTAPAPGGGALDALQHSAVADEVAAGANGADVAPGDRPVPRYWTRWIAGGTQPPVSTSSRGAYSRIVMPSRPLGAGSQFESLPAPGDAFWM